MINLPIGQVLLSGGLITEQQLKIALEEQRLSKTERLGDIILKFGFITEEQYLKALATRLNVSFVKEPVLKADAKALSVVPYPMAVKYSVMPLSVAGNLLTLMTHDPLDFYRLDDIKILAGMEIRPVLALRSSITASIENCYSEEQKRVEIYNNDVMSIARDVTRFLHDRQYKGVSVQKTENEVHITIKLK